MEELHKTEQNNSQSSENDLVTKIKKYVHTIMYRPNLLSRRVYCIDILTRERSDFTVWKYFPADFILHQLSSLLFICGGFKPISMGDGSSNELISLNPEGVITMRSSMTLPRQEC